MSELSKYPEVTNEVIREHGLSDAEYEQIKDFLQRDANSLHDLQAVRSALPWPVAQICNRPPGE